MARILLVNTNRIKPVVAPIGLDYLGEVLDSSGHDVDLLDLALTDDFRTGINDYFNGNTPDVIGISIRNTDDCYYTSQAFFIPQIKEITDHIKKKTRAPVVFGGVGFSVIPEAILRYCQIDLGIKGDGEEAFPTLVDRLVSGDDHKDIAGLVYKDDGVYSSNPVRPIDLEKHACFTRNVVDNAKYYEFGGMGSVETKRGCEKACIYCGDPIAKGRKYRLRLVGAIVDEFEYLVKQGVYHFHLCDSEFNLPYDHAIKVCREMIKRSFGSKIEWYAYLSPKPFTEELAVLMKEAGCVGIDFGVDSGSDAVLKIYRRDFTVDDMVNTASVCKRQDIVFMYDLLLGGPGETGGTLKETIDLMKQIKPSRVGISIGMRIYPGTEIAARVKAEGFNSSNPSLFGSIVDNPDFLEPVFYISNEIKGNVGSLVGTLVNGDERFFFTSPDEVKKNYNYNENIVLIDAIKKGYRGAFWDILRRLEENEESS